MKPVKTQITDLAAVCHETPNEKIAEHVRKKCWSDLNYDSLSGGV